MYAVCGGRIFAALKAYLTRPSRHRAPALSVATPRARRRQNKPAGAAARAALQPQWRDGELAGVTALPAEQTAPTRCSVATPEVATCGARRRAGAGRSVVTQLKLGWDVVSRSRSDLGEVLTSRLIFFFFKR